jgi:hypothetical protein
VWIISFVPHNDALLNIYSIPWDIVSRFGKGAF